MDRPNDVFSGVVLLHVPVVKLCVALRAVSGDLFRWVLRILRRVTR